MTVYQEIEAERERAHRKHGDTSMEAAPPDDPTGRRYRILVEEVGEIAREYNDAEHDGRPVDLGKVREELIQTAAMAAAWADAIAPSSLVVYQRSGGYPRRSISWSSASAACGDNLMSERIAFSTDGPFTIEGTGTVEDGEEIVLEVGRGDGLLIVELDSSVAVGEPFVGPLDAHDWRCPTIGTPAQHEPPPDGSETYLDPDDIPSPLLLDRSKDTD